MNVKNIFAAFIGILQFLIGGISIILSLLIYSNFDFFPIRTIFNIHKDHINFYIFLLVTLGFFLILSGFLIIFEWILKK